MKDVIVHTTFECVTALTDVVVPDVHMWKELELRSSLLLSLQCGYRITSREKYTVWCVLLYLYVIRKWDIVSLLTPTLSARQLSAKAHRIRHDDDIQMRGIRR